MEKKLSLKRQREQYLSQFDFSKPLRCEEALSILQGLPPRSFSETVELALQLGINAKRSDQVVRGAVVLPHGTGREVKVAVFASGPSADEARQAGADVVGVEDLAARIQNGDCPFQCVIAHPQHMPLVGRLGPILGPKSLMPNPKLGTVSANIGRAVRDAKAGQVRFRNDKAGIVHVPAGKLNFLREQLVENLKVLVAEIRRQKPQGSRGVFLKQASLSSTMGPGIKVQVLTLE